MLNANISTKGASSEKEDMIRLNDMFSATTIAKSPRINRAFFFKAFQPNRTASLLEKNLGDIINNYITIY